MREWMCYPDTYSRQLGVNGYFMLLLVGYFHTKVGTQRIKVTGIRIHETNMKRTIQ